MALVDRVKTPLTELELAQALRAGHVEALGSEPSADRLCVAWAQCALEHARGEATYCHNIGNVTAHKSWPGDYYELRVKERIRRDPDLWQELTLRFRAHATPVAGAADFWSLLARRYASVLPLFDSGDANGAAWRLSALGYYTARAEHYSRGMASLAAHYRAKVAPVLVGAEPEAEPDTEPELAAEDRLWIDGLVALGLDRAARRLFDD